MDNGRCAEADTPAGLLAKRDSIFSGVHHQELSVSNAAGMRPMLCCSNGSHVSGCCQLLQCYLCGACLTPPRGRCNRRHGARDGGGHGALPALSGGGGGGRKCGAAAQCGGRQGPRRRAAAAHVGGWTSGQPACPSCQRLWPRPPAALCALATPHPWLVVHNVAIWLAWQQAEVAASSLGFTDMMMSSDGSGAQAPRPTSVSLCARDQPLTCPADRAGMCAGCGWRGIVRGRGGPCSQRRRHAARRTGGPGGGGGEPRCAAGDDPSLENQCCCCFGSACGRAAATARTSVRQISGQWCR